MQVMSVHGHRALGVLAERGPYSGRFRRTSSSGSDTSPQNTSPLLAPADASDELVSIVRSRECAALVIPSEGKQVLAMALEDMVKSTQVREESGRDRGEERMPGLPAPAQTMLSPHCVLSIVDVFICLGKLYAAKLGEELSTSVVNLAWDVEPVADKETSEHWWAGKFAT
ncbi:hypothetical protein IAR55_000360 [Kwoniella newhampshirensis]|uniref:Uncharacterized protein n=1 Tax=Kwoniella newhampshirensis TaxID=1651941 RepID=A0AAW0Z6G0_9TREE